MSSTKRNYFGKEIHALKLFGVSLTGDESLPYKIYSVLFLFPTLYLYPVLNFYEYFKHDTSAISDIIMYQLGSFVGLCKVTIVLRNRIKFGKLLAKLEQEPFTPNIDRGGELEEILVGECVKWTNVQTYTFWTFTTLSVIFTLAVTAIKRITSEDYHDWIMPFGPFTLFNATYSPYYELDWFYQYISMVSCGMHYITTDLILAAVLAHITYQFRLLQNVMKRIVKTARKKMVQDTISFIELKASDNSILNNESDGSDIPWKYLKKSMVEAVQYHVAIIDVNKELENVFSYLLLVLFLGTLVLLCFCIYAASSALSRQSAAKHLSETFIACVQIAMVSFWGEQVSRESQLVAKAAYESDFIGADLRFQKMLAFIICRSQIPVKITAGKFADISLATFAWMPGTRCNIATCNNSLVSTRKRNQQILYHKFPKDEKFRVIWIQRCKREGKWNDKSCRICSNHFKETDYEKNH